MMFCFLSKQEEVILLVLQIVNRYLLPLIQILPQVMIV